MAGPAPPPGADLPHIPRDLLYAHVFPHLDLNERVELRADPKPLDRAVLDRMNGLLRARLRPVWPGPGPWPSDGAAAVLVPLPRAAATAPSRFYAFVFVQNNVIFAAGTAGGPTTTLWDMSMQSV